jgi:hypothetical protein
LKECNESPIVAQATLFKHLHENLHFLPNGIERNIERERYFSLFLKSFIMESSSARIYPLWLSRAASV